MSGGLIKRKQRDDDEHLRYSGNLLWLASSPSELDPIASQLTTCVKFPRCHTTRSPSTKGAVVGIDVAPPTITQPASAWRGRWGFTGEGGNVL